MSSKLSSIVNSVIGERKGDIANKVYGYEGKVRDIERRLDNDGAVYKPAAINDLHALFSYHLTKDDYRKIEKELNYNIK